MRPKPFVKKGDEVLVLSGKDRGRSGKVIQVMPREGKVIIEGIHIVKKHKKPTQKTPQGGIIEMPGPVHISNCMVICPRCKKPTRVKREEVGGRRDRRCRKCGESLNA